MESHERKDLLRYFQEEREKFLEKEHEKFVEDTLKWLARMKKK